jgi:hypothetical protein
MLRQNWCPDAFWVRRHAKELHKLHELKLYLRSWESKWEREWCPFLNDGVCRKWVWSETSGRQHKITRLLSNSQGSAECSMLGCEADHFTLVHHNSLFKLLVALTNPWQVVDIYSLCQVQPHLSPNKTLYQQWVHSGLELILLLLHSAAFYGSHTCMPIEKSNFIPTFICINLIRQVTITATEPSSSGI